MPSLILTLLPSEWGTLEIGHENYGVPQYDWPILRIRGLTLSEADQIALREATQNCVTRDELMDILAGIEWHGQHTGPAGQLMGWIAKHKTKPKGQAIPSKVIPLPVPRQLSGKAQELMARIARQTARSSGGPVPVILPFKEAPCCDDLFGSQDQKFGRPDLFRE